MRGQGGMFGNFDKIKIKGPLVNTIQFSQMIYLILSLNKNELNNNSFSKLGYNIRITI